jgi:hypothetical protein
LLNQQFFLLIRLFNENYDTLSYDSYNHIIYNDNVIGIILN